MQGRIAERVAAALDLTLGAAERSDLVAKPTANPEAYEYYLRALAAVGGGGAVDRRRQVDLYQRAIAVDSTFAQAWAGLAQAHAESFRQQEDRSPERLELARQAAVRTREMAPNLAAARTAMGFYYVQAGAPERAAREYEEALRTNPNDAGALWALSALRRTENRLEDALRIRLEALAQDPRNYGWTWNTAALYADLNRFDEAERYFDRAIGLQPGASAAHWWKAVLYLAWRGDTARARQELRANADPPAVQVTWQMQDVGWRLLADDEYQRALGRERPNARPSVPAQYLLLKAAFHGRRGEQSAARTAFDSARVLLERLVRELPNDAILHSGLGIAYAGLGRKAEAIREGRMGVELTRESSGLNPPGRLLNLARIYLMVGEPEQAVAQLARVLALNGMVTAAWLRADPLWAPLRNRADFRALVAQ